MSSTPYLLKVKITNASNVPIADPNGKSDPYVVIHMDGKILGRTQTIPKDLNPTWNYISDSSFPLISRFLILSFRIFDRDLKKNDDYLGVCDIHLDSIEPDGTFYPLCLIPVGIGEYHESAKSCRLFIEIAISRNSSLIHIQSKTHETDGSSTSMIAPVSPYISRLFSHKYLSFDKSSKLIQNAIKKICYDFSSSASSSQQQQQQLLSESLFYDILLEISKEQFPTMKETSIMENGFISRNALQLANYRLKYHFNQHAGRSSEMPCEEAGQISDVILPTFPSSFFTSSNGYLPITSSEERAPITSKEVNSIRIQFHDKKESQFLLSFQHRLHCWNFLRVLFLLKNMNMNGEDGNFNNGDNHNGSFLSVLLSSQFYVHCSFLTSSGSTSQEMNKVLHFSSSGMKKKPSFFLFIGDLRFAFHEIDWISSSCDSVLPTKYCFSGKVKMMKDSEDDVNEDNQASMSLLSWKNQTIPLLSGSSSFQRVTLDCEDSDLVNEGDVGSKGDSLAAKVACHEISFSSSSNESQPVSASLETPLIIKKDEKNSKSIVKLENLSFQHSFGKKQCYSSFLSSLFYDTCPCVFSFSCPFFLS
jgi:hypothetical protein